MKQAGKWWIVLLLTAGSMAQTAAPTAGKNRAASRQNVEGELQQLRDDRTADRQQIQTLQQEIALLKQEMRKRDDALQQVQASLSEVKVKADQSATQASQQQQTVADLRTDVADLKQTASTTVLNLQETQKNLSGSVESPLAIHFKGVTIIPGGFMAGETVWRSHALGADINTPFNSVPFPGANAAHLTEFFGSGRQSRLSMLGEGRLGTARLTGYFESDFLSAGITSNNNQSNSYSLRQRQLWAQAALDSGWSFTGGQMWSLVTETRQGTENRTEALPMTIDPQYTVGFSWARQYGFRVAKNFHNKFWLGASVENAQALFAATGQSQNFL